MARRGTSGTAKPQEQANESQAMAAPANNLTHDRGNGRGSLDSAGDGRQGGQEQMSFSSEEIAERAYQIYEREGRTDGKDMDHWLQAERELREERERQQSRSATPDSRAPSPNRPQRPDEAPRSARRHQPAMV